MVSSLVISTLRAMSINVTDLGLATTPTVELAVTGTKSDGGIIVTASHNPFQWNALKLLNWKGEFLSAKDGEEVLRLALQRISNLPEQERKVLLLPILLGVRDI